MAIKISKPGHNGFSFGVRGSLFAAFAVIAGMAIVISAGAGLMLGRLGGTMVDLSGRDIPRLAASLQLSAQSTSLANQGPALLAARSEEALNDRTKKMKETQTVALQKLGEIVELGADKAVVAALTENVKNIDDMIKSLGSAARERLELAARHEKLYDAVRKAQRRFTAAAGPAASDAQTELQSIYAAANFSQNDAIKGHKAADQLGDIAASGNMIAFDMIAALSTNNGDTLESIEKEFRTAQARVKANVELLPNTTAMRSVKAATLNLLALGDGKTGVFKVRQQELDADDYGQTILEETRKLNVGLGISVQQLVDGVQKETDASTWQARQEISFATMAMLGLGVATLLGSILFVWLYVGRNILRRISSLQRSMQLLSSGDLEAEIYQSRQQDEIAAMANSLLVFRESMIQSRALSADQDKDRIAKAERASRMEARIVEFETTVRTALDSLQTAAGSMQTTAQSMSATADQSSALVSAVASAAEETSVNVQTVSSGTEELSSSIAEIGRQVVTSAEIARKAVEEAGATDSTMQGLADNAAQNQRGGRSDPDHRLADQSAGAERHHRSRACRRCRPRIRRGRFRSEEPRQPDRESHRRNPPADRQHADGDDHGGRRDQEHQHHDQRDQRGHHRDRGCGRGAGCGDARNRAQHPACRRRHQRGLQQHRRRLHRLDASRNRGRPGADRLRRAAPRSRRAARGNRRVPVEYPGGVNSRQTSSFRDGAPAPNPESRDSGFDAAHRPGMTAPTPMSFPRSRLRFFG